MRNGVLRTGAVLLALAGVAALGTKDRADARASPGVTIRDVSLELVGQVTNTPLGVTPSTSTAYGYLSYLRGPRIFTSEPQSEATAVFTFYLDATTLRVISNGPLRVITRVGTFTVYRDPAANGNFTSPDSFRDGTPILVARLRQQVVIDTITNAFTTLNVNRITSTSSFSAGKRRLQLGEVGATFKTVLSGHQNMPGPPSAFFAGYTTS
jgi:hypothetical protein